MRRVVLFGLAALMAAAMMVGCSHVKPWQREQMVRIEQQLDESEPNRRYEEHMWSVREAAAGGTVRVGGGGCGCN